MVDIEEYVNKTIEIFPDLLKILTKKMKKFQKKMKSKKGFDFGDAFGGLIDVVLGTFEQFARDFEKIGVSSQEFMQFGEDHAEEIYAYLNEHPEIKEKFNKYTTKFNELTKQE
jgi:hypothetical protein